MEYACVGWLRCPAVVREEDEKRAIAALTARLSLWAAGKYGVNPAYGDG